MATASALAKGIGKEVTKTAVKTALGSLWKLLKYEWCLQDSVKKGLRRLEAELKMMQASIGDVSSGPQDQINSVDKLWLTEVEELSCTIVTGLQSFLSSIESTKDALFSAAYKLYINHKIDSFIQEKMTKAKEVSERRGRYGFTSSQTTSAQEMGPRIHALFRKESDLVGLDEATKKLIQMLSKRDHVSIVGMGGMGKTTLARAVYGKLAMKENFDCCAFIPVGQHANVDKVLTDILEDLHIDIPYRNPEAWKLIKLLQASLEGKRCLFVFDDIWEDETWEMIKFAFVGTSEIRIITTTRNVEVAKPVDGAKPVEGVYFIEPLSDASSEMLLRTRLFITEAPDSEFFRLSNKILSKCGGVPIAIITIASLLATKKRVEWSEVYDSIGFGEPGKEDAFKNIMRILSYSYDDLPDHLQKCFLYLSLFPEGHWIEKNMLIWRWVAEGLVPGGSFQLGEKYFNKLIERSMIQRAVSPRDLGQGGCRVHKMMFDLIRRLSSSENKNFSTVIGTKRESTSQTSTIHRLAIHKTRVDESENTSTLPKKSPNTSLEVGEVLSFYASTCSGSSLPPLSKFTGLRVVDLEGCDLSDGDRKLEHLAKSRELAYVGLLGTPVAELPKEIGLLEFLQTLDVTRTGIKELPPFVEKLKKLSCLRAGKGTRMMGRVGELTSLEELWLHSADKSPDLAAELRKLTELRVLVIHFDEMDQAMGNVLVESLSYLTKLQVLQIWSDTEERVRFSSWGDSEPYLQLRQLLLFGVILPKDTPWIHSCVQKLSKLLLEVETLDASHIFILGQMPSLLSLYLHSEDGNRLSYTAGKDEFKVLEFLYTNIELVCRDGALPRIQELEVAGIKVGTEVGLQGNMPLLERVTYHLDCKDCGPEEVREAEETLKEASEAHPNHPALIIKRFNNVWLEMTHTMRSLLPELVKAIGAQGPCDAGSELQSFLNLLGSTIIVDRCLKAVPQWVEICGAAPTLAVGEAGTGSPSQVIKISTDITPESIAVAAGIDYDKFSNEMEMMLGQIPEFRATMKSVVRNADGSLLTSELTGGFLAHVQAMMSAFISQFLQNVGVQAMMSALKISQVEQNAGVLGSGEAISPNPIMPMLSSSAIFESVNKNTSRAQEGNDQISEVVSERLLAEVGRTMADIMMQNPEFFEYLKTLARNVMKAYTPGGLNFAAQKTDGPGKTGEAGKQPTEDSGAGLRRESLPEVWADSVLSWLNAPDGAAFSSERLLEKHEQKLMMPSSLTPGYTSGGGQTDASIPAFASLTAGPTMDVAASSSASVAPNVGVAPGSSQDGENFAKMFNLKELSPAIEQNLAACASSGQPSSKPGNVEEKAPARK